MGTFANPSGGSAAPKRTLRTLAAALIALLAVARLPRVLALADNSKLFANNPLSLVLLAGLALLLYFAFGLTNKRQWAFSLLAGGVFSGFLTVGSVLSRDKTFPPVTLLGVLDGLLTWLVFAAVLGSGVCLLFQTLAAYQDKQANSLAEAADPSKESRFSRLTGNVWVVMAFLLLCWLPVWLAFWPGTFRYDSVPQYLSWVEGTLSTHHPLIHTMLLGLSLDLGQKLSSMGTGLALYCGVQMLVMGAILSYACHWLWRRRVPLRVRLCVILLFALFPLYPLWSFSATKDVVFGGLVLLTVLQLLDFRREDGALESPRRMVCFVLTAAMMMLWRNNGVYAMVLTIPFVMLLCKHRRLRTLLACGGAVLVYMAANGGLTAAFDAESGSSIEMLSIPLQQIGRVTVKAPELLTDDNRALLEELFPNTPIQEAYDAQYADPVKWALIPNSYEKNSRAFLGLWKQLGLKSPGIYLEAFLVHNLGYYYPGEKLRYNIVLGIDEMEPYRLEPEPILPGLQAPYLQYDKDLTFLGLPGVSLLSNTAFMVWLCILWLCWGLYRRQYGLAGGCVFLLALWVTCLLGPVCIMRYLLGLFYTLPVLSADLLGSRRT